MKKKIHTPSVSDIVWNNQKNTSTIHSLCIVNSPFSCTDLGYNYSFIKVSYVFCSLYYAVP